MLASSLWWVNITKVVTAKNQGASRSTVNVFKLTFSVPKIANVLTAKTSKEVKRDEPCFKETIT